MEKVRINKKNLSLKNYFIYLVAITVSLILCSSAISVYLCSLLQKKVIPDSQEVWLLVEAIYADGTVSEIKQRVPYNNKTPLFILEEGAGKEIEDTDVKYTIEKIQSSYENLTSKRKIIYQVVNALKVILPIIYSLIGVSSCAWWFYRKKLEIPLNVLSDATQNISNNNLEFSISYESQDEMGELCNAFEKMRQTLYENNRELWNIIEERKNLQASVAHDLRNPITIIKGYAEYLLFYIENGNFNKEKVTGIASNMVTTAKRMERYTESIRHINSLEALDIKKEKCNVTFLLEEIAEDFRMVAIRENLAFHFTSKITQCEGRVDRQILFRILENIFMNAIRYAQTMVVMNCTMVEDILTIEIIDDGMGFEEDILRGNGRNVYEKDEAGEHLGMGLKISKILCMKHNGSCEIVNQKGGGAKVSIHIKL